MSPELSVNWWRSCAALLPHLRRVTVGLLVIGLTILSPGGPSFVVAMAEGDGEADAAIDTALRRFDGLNVALRALRGTLDRTQFDVEALALDLAFDEAEEIVGFVRDGIAYQPYPGLLRGPTGTLMGRSGNALDQAVLLATLLNAAGYESRIQVGRLELGTARSLVDGVRDRPLRPGPFADTAAMGAILERLEADLDAPPGSLIGLLEEFESSTHRAGYGFEAEVLEDVASIETALADAGLSFADAPGIEDFVEEAMDYAWVEYRVVAADWLEAHPAFGGSDAPPAGLAVVDTLTGTVPPKYQHRLRIESFIERRRGGATDSAPLMAALEVPVANVIGRPFTYMNVPDGQAALEQGDILDPSTVIEATTMFFPLLDGRPPEGAMAFDLVGNTVPPDAAGSPMAGVFRAGGAAVARATTALDGLGSASTQTSGAASQVVAHTLVFTLIAPGGEETVHERRVRLPVDDDAGVVRALSREHTFMVSTGVLSDGFVMDRLLERTLASEPLLRASVIEGIDPDRTVLIDDHVTDVAALAWPGHLVLYQAFDDQPGAGSASVTFRPSPALVVRTRDILPLEGVAKEVVDVIANPRRSFHWRGGELVADVAKTLASGVWETYAEGLLVDDAAIDTFSATSAMRAPDGSRLPVRVLTPDDRDDLASLVPDDVTRSNMTRDLEAGYVLVAPVAPHEGPTGWWRVDLASGETLGIISDGRGGVEYSVLLLGVAVALIAVLTCGAVAVEKGGGARSGVWTCLGVGITVGAVIIQPITWGGVILAAVVVAIGFLDAADV